MTTFRIISARLIPSNKLHLCNVEQGLKIRIDTAKNKTTQDSDPTKKMQLSMENKEFQHLNNQKILIIDNGYEKMFSLPLPLMTTFVKAAGAFLLGLSAAVS